MTAQLTFDGQEVEMPVIQTTRSPLTGAQREILQLARRQGQVRSREAGRIVHLHRSPRCGWCVREMCGFASSDGNDALKRLAKRGFLRRIAPGLWIPREVG
jgi:hypothetical protein